MSMPSRNPIPFDRPAIYQISVQGRIDPTTSDILGGMTISQATVEASPPVTTLVGELSDQAALLVATQNFSGTDTLPFVLVGVVLMLLILLPVAKRMGARSEAAA